VAALKAVKGVGRRTPHPLPIGNSRCRFFGFLDVVKVLNRGALKEQLMPDENIVS
jgi:hypothetical protein